MSGGAHSLPPERREILVKLQAQRNELQDRIRELHTQKRNLMLPPPLKQDARVRIRGAAHPGVIVAIQDCTLLVESAERTVEFRRSGGSLERRPLSADKAA
jgi:hypothetical protein